MRPESYVCIVCERYHDTRWWSARERKRALPPLCTYCEGAYTEGVREPARGAFMDRRNAMRIAALSEALLSAANAKQWSEKHGRA